jgi:glyoxylase-like metal-dependent hydrolase (beta-lactamase superfamily II)
MDGLTRRSMVQAAIGAGAAISVGSGLAARPAKAAVAEAAKQNAGFYRMRLGDFELTVLHDGALTFPYPDGFVSNVSKDQGLAAAEAAYMPKGMVTIPFNPTLINTGSKLVLIDAGNGPNPNGAVGQLFANLAAAGVRPEDIDLVLVSHLHPDHINGLGTADGKIAFPNAEVRAAAPDWAFWMSDENMAKAQDQVTKNYFANTRKTFAGLTDRIGTFEWGEQVAPGITSIASPGHTPGHSSFAVASGSARVLIQVDVTNIPSLFLRHPDWHVVYDHDPELAQSTRHAIYDMAAAERMPVIGYHFPFPSVGHVERDGAGYRLVPISWSAML